MQVFAKNDMMKISKVADRLGVSRQHIYNLIDRGVLKAFRYGTSRAWFIPRASVEEFERASVIDPAA